MREARFTKFKKFSKSAIVCEAKFTKFKKFSKSVIVREARLLNLKNLVNLFTSQNPFHHLSANVLLIEPSVCHILDDTK